MKEFTTLLLPREAREAFARAYTPRPAGSERVPLLQANGRVLAEEIRAESDLPAFDRSAVDGYAVRSADTAGATNGTPIPLALAGEVLMGEAPEIRVESGTAVRIPTGGALPVGADAVVMQEHTVRQDRTVRVERPVAPGDNVTRRGEDLRVGDLVLRPGRRLRPADVGLLAGLNRPDVEVYIRPKVALITTGDELVSPGRPSRAGQVYDMNTYALSGYIEQSGSLPVAYGIVGDSLQQVIDRARGALRNTDALILSGGSSVGDRDVVADAIAALGAPGIVVHGIAIRPGKPTILALADGKPVFGLPGNVVSALIIYHEFVRPVIEELAGMQYDPRPGRRVRARMAKGIAAREREDHVRVTLVERDGALWAAPVRGGSAIMTSMVHADGIVVVPAHGSAVEGSEVEVELLD
jgi:molybdopterin molybdotransferase